MSNPGGVFAFYSPNAILLWGPLLVKKVGKISSSKLKVAPLLGPQFKEAKMVGVRKGGARRRSASRNGLSGNTVDSGRECKSFEGYGLFRTPLQST